MNVSAELIKSLENMLTPEQFKDFNRAVRLENNPQAPLLEAWVNSPCGDDFMERLLADVDEHGLFTNNTVLELLTDCPWLLYACQCKVHSDYVWLVGNKADLEEFCRCKDVRKEPRKMAAGERTWRGDWREGIVKGLTQGLCALGVIARTDYAKDCDGSTRRCYKVLN